MFLPGLPIIIRSAKGRIHPDKERRDVCGTRVLHTGAIRCMLTIGREIKAEIPAKREIP